MTPFEYLSVGLSFVIGLAIAHVLSVVLKVFHARRDCPVDWLPLTWTAYVLVFQMQYWWTLFQVAGRESWTLQMFCLLFLIAIVLFLAGGLMLPQNPAAYPAGLRHYFESDGKWGVLAFNAYFALGILGNVTLFDFPPLDRLHVLMMVVIASGVLFTRLKARRKQIIATVIHGALLLAAFLIATPLAY